MTSKVVTGTFRSSQNCKEVPEVVMLHQVLVMHNMAGAELAAVSQEMQVRCLVVVSKLTSTKLERELEATVSKPKRRCGMLLKTDDMVPNVETAEPTEADKLLVAVDKAIAEVTLGYALMTKYLAQFRKSIAMRGLQNKVIWNAMIVAVHPSAIDKDSLQLIQLGTYDNKVKRGREARGLASMKNLLDKAIEALTKELDKNGSWLVQFVDREKLDKHPDHSLLVHQFTSNVPVTALADNDNDRLYQVLNILEMLNDMEKARYSEEVQHHEGST
ncbi:hypothetical protein EDD15DRAFT_2190550 [Pisolithus albus]|nr:hypothetical protein EDD15DRAFT_2190550 [Pisolithus albus]